MKEKLQRPFQPTRGHNRTVEHIEAWRRWLNRPDNYGRGHELWLTEFGAWNCAGNDYSNCNSDHEYMEAIVPFLNRRVTRYAWFVTHTCHSPMPQPPSLLSAGPV